MLVLTRKPNQAIVIGDDIRIVVVSVDRDQVRLGGPAGGQRASRRGLRRDPARRSAHQEGHGQLARPDPITAVRRTQGALFDAAAGRFERASHLCYTLGVAHFARPQAGRDGPAQRHGFALPPGTRKV